MPQNKSLVAHGMFEAKQNVQFWMKIIPAENIKQKSMYGSSPLSRSHRLCLQPPKQSSNCCFPEPARALRCIHPDLFPTVSKPKLVYFQDANWADDTSGTENWKVNQKRYMKVYKAAISLLAMFSGGISHFKTWSHGVSGTLLLPSPWTLGL